ncbi:MAG: hypothetical protein DRJ64_08445 [Thermoprotei archaeon]|nr:MAG: hypothetical protein DRJ64_08445 [Thermoprotei archaeon]
MKYIVVPEKEKTAYIVSNKNELADFLAIKELKGWMKPPLTHKIIGALRFLYTLKFPYPGGVSLDRIENVFQAKQLLDSLKEFKNVEFMSPKVVDETLKELREDTLKKLNIII